MRHRVNRQIRVPEVRVIGPDGKMLGVMPTREALRLAESLGLDLVEVSPNVRPPVVKILDYGKFLYEEKKRRREARKNADAVKLRGGEVKELNFSATIDNHDLQVKSRKARDLLEDGYKVRIRIYFKGRQIAHAEVGRSAMDRMIESLMDIGEVEQPPRMEGRNLIAVIRPLSKKKRKSSQEQRTKEES